jgi:hypothetical protein
MPWKMASDGGHHMPLCSIHSGAKIEGYTLNSIDGGHTLSALLSIDTLTEIAHSDLEDPNAELRYVGGEAVESSTDDASKHQSFKRLQGSSFTAFLHFMLYCQC